MTTQNLAIAMSVISAVLLLLCICLWHEMRITQRVLAAAERDINRFKQACDHFHKLSLGLSEKIARDNRAQS